MHVQWYNHVPFWDIFDCQAQRVHLGMRLRLLTLSQRGSDEV